MSQIQNTIKLICIIYIFPYINFYNKYKNIENYLDFCNRVTLSGIKSFESVENPKISIISPVYNREKYILRFLSSIQNQSFKDIEILFVDDFSLDNSLKLIEFLQKKDKRIKLIKNKKNKGTFISRNIGILKSKGKYLMIPDPDDILTKNSLQSLYNFSEKNKYDIIRFNIYLGKGVLNHQAYVDSLESRSINQPELTTYLFYGLGRLTLIDYNISNKFIRRELLIKVLNHIKSIYLSLYMVYFEDGLILFILHRLAKSYYFLKKVLYYYVKNKHSITSVDYNSLFLKSIFYYLKFVYLNSKNTKVERGMTNYNIYNLCKGHKVKDKFIVKKEDYDLFSFTLLNLLKNKFITIENKKYLNELKEELFKLFPKKNK